MTLDLLRCDERCAPNGQCYELTRESPEGPRIVAMVHWRIVPFLQDAHTGALTPVPDDGHITLRVEGDVNDFPLSEGAAA